MRLENSKEYAESPSKQLDTESHVTSNITPKEKENQIKVENKSSSKLLVSEV